MKQFTLEERREIEQDYFRERRKWEARAEATRELVVNRAKKHATAAGIPTKDTMWSLYLHNWFACPIARGHESELLRRGCSREQIKHAKKAIHILNKQWEPSRLLRTWSDWHGPSPMRPERYNAWIERQRRQKASQ